MTQAHVHSLQISPGGVPKLSVDAADVTASGLVGDGQRSPGHGGPRRAVLLLGLDAIEALRAEGHPIVPGATGDNVTVAGLVWADLRPGDRIRFEGGVVLETTEIAAPCGAIRRAFADEDFARLDGSRAGHGRWCSRVVTPGHLRAGETLTIERSEPAGTR